MLRNCVCVVIAHMVDATQLCLSCHCTHGGCYATLFVLSLHTWWMLRNSVCLVIAHMVDATQLCLSCRWGVRRGGVEMMTFLELAHMVDATQLCLSCHCTHGGCYEIPKMVKQWMWRTQLGPATPEAFLQGLKDAVRQL